MKNIWRAITIQNKRFEEERMKAQTLAETLQREAKKSVHLLVHRRLLNVSEKLRLLREEVACLLGMVKKNPLLHHARAIDDGLEEYAEFVALAVFLEKNSSIAAFVKGISSEALIGGIADATGELVRIARAKMDEKEGENIREHIISVYHHLLDLPITRNGKLRSKTEDVRRNLLRTEEILFDIRIRAHSSAG